MTPLAGFIAAIIAGWLIRDARRATAAVIVPFLAILALQTYGIGAGYGHSPPSTVLSYPSAISYWVVQVIILAPALLIAAGVGSLRAGQPGRPAIWVSAGLTFAAGVFDLVYALQAAPVHHHLANGSPPWYGLVGIATLFITAAVTAAMLLRRRLTSRRRTPAAVATSAVPAAERR
jgi:hypothetical protein